ncbi:shikimate 5-dehydrogenase [Tomitella biformata]|uniref:shikimate 5-dehydrogenase n=1 Tax=Tomitella biformata TaxID=630403 RepID=UPI0004640650|nr:shikimate 5-dehydrogenase [Tomitella biformata]
MTLGINKDTTLCISLAARPSNIGTRFHNFLYAELGLDFVYKAFTTTDLAGAVAGIRALGIRGAGISMPFKRDCMPMLDALDQSAVAIDAVNTIVNEDGHLTGYNTDVLAVQELLPQPDGQAVVAGSGGMASAALAALRGRGYEDLVVLARNAETGRALARMHGCDWIPELGPRRPALLLNATPQGMAGDSAAQLPFDDDAIAAAHTVFDVVAMPPRTPLIRRAEELGASTVTGDNVIALQAAEQFAMYTGVRPSDEQISRASAYSREV